MSHRGKESSRQEGQSPSPFRRLMPWRNVLLLLVALSLYQYFVDGEVTWHREIIGTASDSVGGYATRPDAGWRRATEQLEKAGARKEGQPTPEFDLQGRVVGVLDGDSIIVLDRTGEETTVRLYGIDAPEKGQPHADVARRTLSELLRKQSVGVVVQDIDQYGRSAGTVYLNESNINLALVAEGHAWWYRHYAPHDRLLEDAERRARAGKLGLWGGNNPVPPWDWRRRTRTTL